MGTGGVEGYILTAKSTLSLVRDPTGFRECFRCESVLGFHLGPAQMDHQGHLERLEARPPRSVGPVVEAWTFSAHSHAKSQSLCPEYPPFSKVGLPHRLLPRTSSVEN